MREQITLVGNIGGPPERRQTSGGVPVASFRVACTERHYDEKSGGWVDGNVSWYRVSAFRRLAENALASLHKGERVIVTGRLRLREWQAGDKRGMEAEIDAEALGHDLLWGVSTFRRTGEAGAGAERPADGGEESSAGDEPIAVGAGVRESGGWSPGDDPTPF